MSSNRKLGWLAARLAAKYLFLSQFQMGPSALRREGYIVKLTGERLRLHSPWMYRHVEVLPPEKAPDAKPVLTWCGGRRSENISLSHTAGVSCASLSATPIAIDIEVATSRVRAFYRRTFTTAERRWVNGRARDDEFKARWFYTLLWTMKESALKLQLLTSATLWQLP